MNPGGFLADLAFYFEAGGFVMWPLVFATIALWYGLGYRMAALRRGSTDPVRLLVDRFEENPQLDADGIVTDAIRAGLEVRRRRVPNLRRRLDDLFGDYDELMRSFRVTSLTVVALAPLIGLLGTVVGMQETFDSLTDMALFSQSGGIAGGISQALITTQFGLAIAIPGLVVHGYLERRAEQLEIDLAQIKDILCTAQATEARA